MLNFCLALLAFLPPDETAALDFLKTALKPYQKTQNLTPCTFKEPKDTYQYLIFISFSVPETIWLSLSRELEKQDGVFILRGIPENNFQAFAQKIMHLRKIGIRTPIQINPIAFDTYNITKVPTFVLQGDGAFDKLSGAVSLRYVKEQLNQKGESNGN